ncbi:uncharacterized protein MAM_07228 [Metarhizium album ARSEF 1941]|uniref:Uncharacterized protein n=1 Tax=Metarhizium album (strain ARSEF 1941) TaxID=1081103 RepID=A0A0B2WG77_METAS|nr:uncharacterized protein MAM_07228 [Metarhizium album ARSEF 1941]KHN95001.1 hypothetical protein MAM_07228 [Metarhizium album ARSEF 1941]
MFNAVHNAGSSVHHNGMSLFLATVPEGVLFHHGTTRPESPSDPDRLAYEIEHAEGFTRSFGGPPRQTKPHPEPMPGGAANEQKIIGRTTHLSDHETGWLHVYRTSRPLQFLYVDGMSGGKSANGTPDTQDYLLRSDPSYGKAEREASPTIDLGERKRAQSLCKLCKEWNLQGIIRMEAGFEIIKCNFTDGMDQVQVFRRPGSRGRGKLWAETQHFEYLRGVAERNFDIRSSRTVVDYSSTVSAFFFPVNLANPDPKRPDLPRLSEASHAELVALKRIFNGHY